MNEVRRIVAAALTAPDHCALRPWRFIFVAGSARDCLGEIFAAIKAARGPAAGDRELERERDQARAIPALIAVVAKLTRDHPRVPVREQHASVGAAIQNMLLCAHALGYGAKMVSGRKTQDPYLTEALGLGRDEQLFGFICLGTPPGALPAVKRPRVDDHLTVWEPATAVAPAPRPTGKREQVKAN